MNREVPKGITKMEPPIDIFLQEPMEQLIRDYAAGFRLVALEESLGTFTGPAGTGLLSTGGLKAVQLSSMVVALPLIPVLILMVFSLMK
ncbi:MAG: hypothetical protein GY737_22320 [Desulfobacteraceae bacterium]|nr:hypothetical protein [Desulfobacteraceae bacterium]